MIRIHFAFLALLFLLVGCGVSVKEIQQIEISTYPDIESNTWLAKGLIYYDPRKLVEKIPSLNEKNIRGLNIGWFVRASDKRPFYRITYNMKDPDVVGSINELKADFEEHIPLIAQTCTLPKVQIRELESIAEGWWELFSSGDFESCWNQFKSNDPSLNYERFVQSFEPTVSQLTELQRKDLLYAHYYGDLAGEENVYSLVYEAKFENVDNANIRVVISYPNESNWKVIGFACKGR